MVCRICLHESGFFGQGKHYPECPFSSEYGKNKNTGPPIRIDIALGSNDFKKRMEKEYRQGKWTYIENGIFEKLDEDRVHS